MPLWTPANLGSALVAWYKADLLPLHDGNPVSYWSDLSGNQYDLAMPFATQQPTYKAGIINGLPVVRFNDDSPAFANPKNIVNRSGFGVPAILTHSQPMLIAVVANVSIPNTSFGIVQTYSGNAFQLGGAFFGSPVNYVYNLNAFTPAEGFKSVQYFAGTNWAATVGGWRLHEGLASISSSDILLDGTSVNNGGTTTVSNSGFNGLTLGNFLNADVLEIIIVADVSVGTRQRIEGYADWRAGIQNSLPIGHPYKTAAPQFFPSDSLLGALDIQPQLAGALVSGLQLGGSLSLDLGS